MAASLAAAAAMVAAETTALEAEEMPLELAMAVSAATEDLAVEKLQPVSTTANASIAAEMGEYSCDLPC